MVAIVPRKISNLKMNFLKIIVGFSYKNEWTKIIRYNLLLIMKMLFVD